MRNSKRMRKVKQIIWWMFVGFCFGITPYIFKIADLQRGYNATGGELIVPFLPVFVWLFIDAINELKLIAHDIK